MNAYWDDTRCKIKEWLIDVAPALAGIYEITVELVYGPQQSPSTGLIAAHGMREIMNSLPEFIAPAAAIVGRVDYPMHCDRISPSWREASLPIGNASAPIALTEDAKIELPVVPQNLIFRIGNLVFDHEAGAKRGPTNRAALFNALNEDYSTPMELLQPIIKEWAALAKWFVGKCHVNRSSDFIPVPIDELRTKIEQLESMLSVMSEKFFTLMESLDEDIQQANS